MKPIGTLKKLTLVLLVVVLLPALFYSGYELSTMSTSEELISSVYQQQLDAVLYSINQYAWDVVSSWASTLSIMANESGSNSEPNFFQFVHKNRAVQAIAMSDSTLAGVHVFTQTTNDSSQIRAGIIQALRTNREIINRLIRYREADYRKIEPIIVGDSTVPDRRLLLVFIVPGAKIPQVYGMLLDETAFIRDVLSRKLEEAAGKEFVLAVFKPRADKPAFSTAVVSPNDLKQQKALWLFPDYVLGIRLKGTTLDDLARARFNRNLLLIGILDVVLIAGVWFVYRSIRREMELVRLKSDFVSNVSHELRTPLALIHMFAETLEMGRVSSETKKQEYYGTILQETERLTRLVNNILNFSRMEAGKKHYEFTKVNLNDVVGRVTDTYQHHLQSEGFEPVIELGSNLPSVHADSEALTEALINIIDNAAKYCGDEKFLLVRTGSTNDMVFVEVEDHGIGIAHEHQQKIFENFFRVQSGLVHNTKGSGLGLSIVKHIVDAHDGTVTVTSVPGKGSCFRLSFPAVHPAH